MRATEELRNDHGTLRAKLALLYRLLLRASIAQPSLRQAVSSLARCLRRHAEKETLLFGLLQERLHGDTRDAALRLLDDHERAAEMLTTILGLLGRGDACAMEQVTAHASRLIDDLQEHMAKEEAMVFPAIDRSLGAAQTTDAVHLMHVVVRCLVCESACMMTPRNAESADHRADEAGQSRNRFTELPDVEEHRQHPSVQWCLRG